MVVLSNNDGCVVARSKEAKALGIKMGVPLHQIQDQILPVRHSDVLIQLRAVWRHLQPVMQTLEALAPAVEVYPLMRAFLDFNRRCQCCGSYGSACRYGPPFSSTSASRYGIALSKTPAKLANHAAKQCQLPVAWSILTDPIRRRNY